MSEPSANGGRRVPASALVSWGSMPQLDNIIRYVFACQGIEPCQANPDAGTHRPQFGRSEMEFNSDSLARAG